jgi:hypothetical protein
MGRLPSKRKGSGSGNWKVRVKCGLKHVLAVHCKQVVFIAHSSSSSIVGKCLARSTKIFNHYFLPHLEKVVVRTPMVGGNHYIKPVEFPNAQDNIEALKFFVAAKVDAAKEVALVH